MRTTSDDQVEQNQRGPSGHLARSPRPASPRRSDLRVARPTVMDRRLATLFATARAMASQHDLYALLSQLLSCLIDIWGKAEAGIFLLYESGDRHLAVSAAQGYHLSPLSQIHIMPGEGMSGRAFQTGQVQLYPTPQAIARSRMNLAPPNRELFQAANAGYEEPHNAVCLPLVAGPGHTDRQRTEGERAASIHHVPQSAVGVLILENRRRSVRVLPRDLPFLQDVVQLFALAIGNVRPQHKQVTDARMYSSATIEETNRLKAERFGGTALLSTLAHEMRTPLTSIKGYSTALLMEEASFSPETQREFLQIIDQECDVLEDLIHDLLESSFIDAGLLKLEPQPVILPRLVHSLVEDLARRTQKHRFLVNFPPGFPIVEADPLRIEQVLRNLLDNAVKYSPGGGMIVVRGETQENRVTISVADQGVGIAPEHLNRLFEEFFRVRSSLGRHVVGSGLGLPIARSIVESHGGHIWAESKLGEGTTFCFTLPIKAVPRGADPGQEEEQHG